MSAKNLSKRGWAEDPLELILMVSVVVDQRHTMAACKCRLRVFTWTGSSLCGLAQKCARLSRQAAKTATPLGSDMFNGVKPEHPEDKKSHEQKVRALLTALLSCLF